MEVNFELTIGVVYPLFLLVKSVGIGLLYTVACKRLTTKINIRNFVYMYGFNDKCLCRTQRLMSSHFIYAEFAKCQSF